MEKIWHEKDLSISRPADTELCWYSVAAVVEPDPCKFIGNGAYPLLQTQALYASIESLRAECKIGSMQATISANILRSREKGLRLPSDQSRRLTFSESATSRLKSKPGARLKAELLSRSLPSLSYSPCIPLNFYVMRPWDRGLSHCTVSPTLPEISNRQDSIFNI